MPRPLVILSAAVLLAGALLHIAAGSSGGTDTSEHAWGADDAYITYRYAQNLAAGEGLVWNPGERVEGYSNLLFVLISALLLFVVSPDSLYLAVSFLNLLFLLLAFALFHRHSVARLGPGHAAAAAWLVALCPSLWLWTASGMETTLVLALQVALWVAVERLEAGGGRRELVVLATVLGLGVLARTDGFVWVAVTAAYLLLRGRRRQALRVVLAVGPVVVALFAWRYAYYGELLPNTYYAKVSETLGVRLVHGVAGLARLALRVGLAPYLLGFVFTALASVFVGGRQEGRPRSRWSFASFFALSLAAYWIYVGGDHYAGRFLVVLFPLGAAVFLGIFADLRGPRLALLAAILLLLQLRPLLEDPRFDYRAERYDCWITLGQFLGEEADADALLAVDAAGKIPYFSGLRALDMRGLTDPHIARVTPRAYDVPGHNKQDVDYVLGQQPDLIAAWVLPNLDLVLGLERALTTRAGYRLRWLLNTSKQSREWNIVDVGAAGDEEIRRLIAHGYRYGVLARNSYRTF